MIDKELVINSNHCSLVKTVPIKTNEFISLKRDNMISADKFWEHVAKLYSTGNSLVPFGTRYYETIQDGSTILVVEDQPMTRIVRVMNDFTSNMVQLQKVGKLEQYGYKLEDYNGEGPHVFSLAFPYVVYIIRVKPGTSSSTLGVFFRTSPVTGLGDYLFKANLFNISQDQWVCLGEGGGSHIVSINDKVEDVKERFWVNIFNRDYIYNYQDYQSVAEVCDYPTWQYFSKVDPMFVFSVDWILHGKTVGQVINSVKEQTDSSPKFTAVTNMFSNVDYHGPDPEHGAVYNNICESVSFSKNKETIVASVGDEIEIGKNTYYINSFIGSKDGYTVTDIEFESEDGNLITRKYTIPLRTALANSLKRSELKEYEISGIKFKVGDIISIEPELNTILDKRMLKVRKIRVARDGKIEVLCGSDYYLLENIKFSVVDLNDITLFGRKVNTNDVFKLTKSNNDGYRRQYPTISYIEAKFMSMDVRRQKVVARFQDVYTKSAFTVDMEESEYNIIDKKLEVTSTDLLRVAANIATHSNRRDGSERSIQYVKGSGVISRLGSLGFDSHAVIPKLLNRDETELTIPGVDFDIHFKIGDTVVIADWNDPVEMLRIRKITHFDAGNYHIGIETELLEGGGERTDKYMDFDYGRISMGKIRKIGASFAGIVAGDKLKANTAGITSFPKKDTNTVVGFIYDTNTKYPLILFSNGLTQWASPSMLEKFDVYKRQNPQYSKLKNAPLAIYKAKIQPGDLFERDSYRTYVVTRSSGTYITMWYSTIAGWNYQGRTNKRDMDDYYNRSGFLSPRLSVAEANSLAGTVFAFPNLHHGLMRNSNSDMRFKEVE